MSIKVACLFTCYFPEHTPPWKTILYDYTQSTSCHGVPYITSATKYPPRRYVTDSGFTWSHDDVIKWKHFPRYWPFVPGIHRSPMNSPQKGQWRGALMFSLICVWINGWVNSGEAGDLRRHRAHYGVTVMPFNILHGFVIESEAIILLPKSQWQLFFLAILEVDVIPC